MEKKNTKVGKYFVLYFDVQGIRRQLFNGIDLRTAKVDSSTQRRVDVVSQTLRKLYARFAEIVLYVKLRPAEYYAYLTGGDPRTRDEAFRQAQINEIQKVSAGVQQFSDSTLVYVRDTGNVSRIVFQQLMARCAFEIVKAMGTGVYVRGAMSYGTGWEIMTNCLFGPIIQEVYELEQKVANTFRIVVTKPFYDVARKDLGVMSAHGCDMEKPYPFLMIGRDPDGVLIFDYLSKVAIENFKRFDPQAIKVAGINLTRAFNRVARRHKALLKRVEACPEESRLVVKYAMYMSYLENRMPNFKPYCRFVKEHTGEEV